MQIGVYHESHQFSKYKEVDNWPLLSAKMPQIYHTHLRHIVDRSHSHRCLVPDADGHDVVSDNCKDVKKGFNCNEWTSEVY